MAADQRGTISLTQIFSRREPSAAQPAMPPISEASDEAAPRKTRQLDLSVRFLM
jgi:hypothetical protein